MPQLCDRSCLDATLITIFVRHSADCKYAGGEFCKRCSCRKHLRWSQVGKQHRKKAGSRSWTGAEQAKRRLEDQLAGLKPEALTQAGYMGELIAEAFDDARMKSEGHDRSPLRATFAVYRLQKGLPLERVSKLLAHKSVTTTERHYAKWVTGRQDRLDMLVSATWTKKP